MKFRQLITANPFQKSRDKKKKKSDQSESQRDAVTPSRKISWCAEDTLIPNVYVNELTFERPQFRLGTSVCFNNHFEYSDDEYAHSITFPIGEDNNSPVPRERSRIRTNPWLKTPTHSCNKLNNDDATSSRNALSLNWTNTDRGELESEESNSVQLRSKRSKPCTESEYRWSIISEGDISIDLNLQEIDSLSEQFKSLQHDCSFEYEDKLDLVLEEGIRRDHMYLSIQDLLSESTETDDSATSMETSEDICVDVEPQRGSSDSECARDTTLMDRDDNASSQSTDENDNVHATVSSMEESIDAGYSSLSREKRFSSESESDSVSSVSPISICSSSSSDNDSDSVSSYSTGVTNDDMPSGRTLPEVRLSLQEKIDQLRLEKYLVQQKVRQAREEERIRQEERTKIKSQVLSQRKHALFKTLNDLKERLENQSVRLQRSYSTVLTMQRRFTRRRATFHCQLPI